MFLVYCFIKLGEGSQMFMVNSDCIPFMSSRSAFIWKLWEDQALVAVASSWRGREQIFTIKLRRIEIFSQFHDGVHWPSAATGRRSGLHPTKSWNSNLCFLNIPHQARLPGWLSRHTFDLFIFSLIYDL